MEQIEKFREWLKKRTDMHYQDLKDAEKYAPRDVEYWSAIWGEDWRILETLDQLLKGHDSVIGKLE